jgi:hypothetical protein
MSLVNYRQRADNCRRLAKLSPKPEDWEHFLDMAQTWEKLADLHEFGRRLRSSGVLLDPRPAPLSQAAKT